MGKPLGPHGPRGSDTGACECRFHCRNKDCNQPPPPWNSPYTHPCARSAPLEKRPRPAKPSNVGRDADTWSPGTWSVARGAPAAMQVGPVDRIEEGVALRACKVDVGRHREGEGGAKHSTVGSRILQASRQVRPESAQPWRCTPFSPDEARGCQLPGVKRHLKVLNPSPLASLTFLGPPHLVMHVRSIFARRI
jgi:hypothetical protein